jgi:hypothetical protein
MKFYPILISIFILFSCSEKKNEITATDKESITESVLPAVSSYFPKEKAKVLVVGVFHFDYPGLDEHKTTDENKVDVLKEPKKSEMTELVEYIKKFKPTKIAIEADPGWGATGKLKEYNQGAHRDKRDERYQLAIRIASEINLDTVYEVNSYSLSRELYETDSLTQKRLTDGIDWEYEDPYWDYTENWFGEDDKLVSKSTLKDYITYINSPESHQYGYGIYLISGFKSGGHKGADMLSIWWYNRNLRIFRNIQDITEGSEDRIMVVMGNGHAAILRQLFEASPEYQFIEFSEL